MMATQLVVAVVLAISALLVGLMMEKLTRQRQKKKERDERSRSAGRLDAAFAATDLVPWVSSLENLSGCKIQIFGSDGGYVNRSNGDVWKQGLREWVKKGLKVDYILLSVDNEIITEYLNLMEDLNGEEKCLDVQVVRGTNPKLSDPDLQATLKDLQTCHPTLLYSKDGEKMAMWVEGEHAEGSDIAYDILYVPPEDIAQYSRDFEHYERKIKPIRESCVSLSE